MNDIQNKFCKIGVGLPEILLPKEDIELEKWSVVACDQYTSQPEYWEAVEKAVTNTPSTYHVTYPELYLEEPDGDKRIVKINTNMQNYINQGILNACKPGFILVDRKTSHSESRKGLVISVDLEKYDYSKDSQSLIRATEGTVVERIPPRLKVRENATIELPHIMLLIDDPDKTVIEPLFEKTESFEKVYDFELMMDGGHIKGYKIDDEFTLAGIGKALEQLANPSEFRNKYGVDSRKGVLLFAVGDGNHSLATAKAHWENVKKTLTEEDQQIHPARFALAEVVNVHDEGITFEPIHRVMFNADVEDALNNLSEYLNFESEIECVTFTTYDEMLLEIEELKSDRPCHVISYIAGEEYGVVAVYNPPHTLEVGTLQGFIDQYIEENPQVKVDYIHGDEVVENLGSKPGNIGFFLPSMNKHDLFRTVIIDGVLPRKTFSMGEAEEKRFYLECRKIR